MATKGNPDMIRKCVATLESLTPYIQSRRIFDEKRKDETYDDFEARIWNKRMHVNESGEVYIPAMQIQKAMAAAAKYEDIPLKGSRNFTSLFAAGVYVADSVPLGVKPDDVKHEQILCSSDGKKGGSGGKQVTRLFPIILQWSADVEFMLLEPRITQDVFKRVLRSCGFFNGFGSFRAQNGNNNGRFKCTRVEWSEA